MNNLEKHSGGCACGEVRFHSIGKADKMVKWLKANPKTINTISACVLIIAATQKY
jgi:hypothetical protein